jgi:hypothetical protein
VLSELKNTSHKGEQGKIAPNLLQEIFFKAGAKPKWATDITEFNVSGKSCIYLLLLTYLTREIISYELTERPVFYQVTTLLKKHLKHT